MREPWIRVRAHLSRAKVAQRLAVICRGDAQKASGVLQDFWSSVAEQGTNGFIRDYPDHTLEDWAGWRGKRGVFATWVRQHHMDDDGRVKEWDEYMGALEARREADRLRKEAERVRRKSAGSPEDVTRKVRTVSAESPYPRARYDDADEYVNENEHQNQKAKNGDSAHTRGRDMMLDRLSGSRRAAMSAKLATLAQGVGLPPGLGVPSDAQLDAACLDLMATCEPSQVSPKVLVRFLTREMRGEPEPVARSTGARGASGWDNVR